MSNEEESNVQDHGQCNRQLLASLPAARTNDVCVYVWQQSQFSHMEKKVFKCVLSSKFLSVNLPSTILSHQSRHDVRVAFAYQWGSEIQVVCRDAF